MRRRLTMLTLVLVSVALRADAQESRPLFDTAAKIYLGAAAADWGSTAYVFARSPYAREANPLYGWVMPSAAQIGAGQPARPHQVAAALALSAGFDVATTYAVQRWLAPRHPTLAKAALLVGAGVRGFAAARNVIRVERIDPAFRR